MEKEYHVSIHIERDIKAEDEFEAREKFLDNMMIDTDICVEKVEPFDLSAEQELSLELQNEATPIIHYQYKDKNNEFDFEAENKDEALRILEDRGEYNKNNLVVVKDDGQILQVINLN